MIKHVKRFKLYTPQLQEATEFYLQLGLVLESRVNTRANYQSATFSFAAGGPQLLLHDDPLLQFTDIELAVDDLQSTYQELKTNANLLWLQLPNKQGSEWQARVRAPDGNIFLLSQVGFD